MNVDVTVSSMVVDEDYAFERYNASPSPLDHPPERYADNFVSREGRDLSPKQRYLENAPPRDRSPERYSENSYPRGGRDHSPKRYLENTPPRDRSPEQNPENSYPREGRVRAPERYGENSFPRDHAADRYPENPFSQDWAADRYPETSLPREHAPDRYPDENPRQSPPRHEFEAGQREVSHRVLLEYVQETVKSVHEKRDEDRELLLRVKEEAELQVERYLHEIDLEMNSRYEAHQDIVQSKLEQLAEVFENIDTLEKELQQFKTVLGHLNNEVKL